MNRSQTFSIKKGRVKRKVELECRPMLQQRAYWGCLISLRPPDNPTGEKLTNAKTSLGLQSKKVTALHNCLPPRIEEWWKYFSRIMLWYNRFIKLLFFIIKLCFRNVLKSWKKEALIHLKNPGTQLGDPSTWKMNGVMFTEGEKWRGDRLRVWD